MPFKYNLYRDGEKIVENLEENSYTDTGLTPNTAYEYQVSAVNEYGESPLSNAITVTTDYSDVTNVKLSKNEVALEVGETESLEVTVSPDTAQQDVEWTSSNNQVATVNSNGVVEAVSDGEATITATSRADSEMSDDCVVTVTEPDLEPEEPEGLSSTGNTDTTVDLEWE